MTYPVNLDIKDKICVVVGGGKVAARKIRDILKAGGIVEVIAPKICPEIEKLAETSGQIKLIREKFSPEKVSPDTSILIAAADDPEVNRLVIEEGCRKKILVNSANGGGDFEIPSKILRGNFLLTISTGGNSPGFSKFVRLMLEREFDENFGEGLKIISRYRERAKKILPDSDSRAKFWQNVFTEDLWRDLKSGELKNLEAKVENAFESFGAELQNDTGGNS